MSWKILGGDSGDSSFVLRKQRLMFKSRDKRSLGRSWEERQAEYPNLYHGLKSEDFTMRIKLFFIRPLFPNEKTVLSMFYPTPVGFF